MPLPSSNVLLGLVLAVLILLVGHFGFHPAEGLPRVLLFGGAALVFSLCAFVPQGLKRRK